MEELTPIEKKGCERLKGLEVIFNIRKVLELEYREVDLKLFIDIYLNLAHFNIILLLYYVDLYFLWQSTTWLCLKKIYFIVSNNKVTRRLGRARELEVLPRKSVLVVRTKLHKVTQN